MTVKFAEEFNKRLGQYTGSMVAPDDQNRTNVNIQELLSQVLAKRMNDAKSKALNKKADTSGSVSDPALGNLSQASVDLITKAGANKKFMGVDMPNIWEIPGPVGKALGPVDEALIGIGIQAPLKTFTTGLDLLARPFYGVANAQLQQAQSYNAGGSFGNQLENVASGFWQGLKGDEKTGFGEAVEEWTKTPEALQTGGASGDRSLGGFGQMLFNAAIGGGFPRLISEELLQPGNDKGWVNTWAKRGLGAFGEAAFDPTNLTGIAPVAKIAEASKVAKGASKGITGARAASGLVDFSDDAYRTLVKGAVKDGVDNAGWSQHMNQAPKLRDKITDPVTGAVTHGPQKPKGLDYLHQVADEAIDNTQFQHGGGASRGRLVGHRETPFAVANNVGIAARRHMTSDFDNEFRYFVDELRNGIKPTSAKIAQLRANVPFFADFLDEMTSISRKARSNLAHADIEKILLDYAKNPSTDFWTNLDEASRTVKATIDKGAKIIQDNVYEKLLGATLNVPGLRVGSKVIPFKRLGASYAGRKLNKIEKGGSLLKGVKYGDTFVGRTPQIAQRVRSLGMKNYEDFHREVTDMVNGRARVYDIKTRKMKVVQVAERLTKEERHTIHTNILGGIPAAPGSRLEEAQNFIQDAYKRIWQEEVDAGVPGRSGQAIQADNYVYNFYRGSDITNKIKAFRDTQKINLRSQTGAVKNLNPNLVKLAEDARLKPEKDAFKALLHRKLKSNRQLTKSWFKQDLIDNYGMMANQLSDDLKQQLNLVEQFKHGSLPRDLELKLGMTKKGDAWYLPKQMHDIYEAFSKLSGGNPEELQGIVRMFDTWTRYFKTAATIPWPGFHIRNGIGDIFMSWIDGVRAKDIAYLKSWDLAARKNPGHVREIAGRNFTFEELRNIFRENASSGGHQNVELIGDTAQASLRPDKIWDATKDLARDPRGIGNVARRASGAREDLFRFNHFLHAFKEELAHSSKVIKNPDRALRAAIDASTARVNKYMFDYAALTRVEQTYLKRAIPFYTYTRKAMPTLIESLFLHPSQFAKTQRWARDDAQTGEYLDMLTPQYQRDIGYSRLPAEEGDNSNPWLLGSQYLPTDLLVRNSNFGNFKEFAQNFSSQTNPFLKLLYERGGGRSYYNDQPIESSGQYLMDSLVPPARPLADIPSGAETPGIQHIPGLNQLDIGGWVSKIPGVGETSKEGFAEKILSGRVGAGLPFDKVNEGQQTAAAYGVLDEIKKRFDAVNGDVDKGTGLEGAGYHLYTSFRKDDSTFRIKNIESGDVVYETTDPQKAMAKAKQLMNK